MTQLPGRSILPITPTCDDAGNPTVCRVCGRVSMGIGVGLKNRNDKDPGFLCRQCLVAVSDLSKLDRMSQFELRAIDKGVEAVGEYIGEHGITELTHYDDLMRRMLVKAAWEGCIRGVREALREAPF